MSPVDAPLLVGNFGRVFGVLGWIKVVSLTVPKENILDIQPWLLKKNGSWEEVCFEDSKKHAGDIIVKLPGCNSPEISRCLTNVEIFVRRDQLPKLKSDEYYWVDLVGLEVINKDGINFGVVQSLIATGSNDVLVVIGDRKRLIPYLSDVILQVDLASKTICVNWDADF